MPRPRRLLIASPQLEHWLEAAAEWSGCLKTLLARARVVSLHGDVPIADALGLSNVPAAPLCRLSGGYEDALTGHWLRFDPVSLLPDLTAVWIQSRVAIDLRHASSTSLVEELKQMLQAEGIAWQPNGSSEYGLIHLEKPFDADFIALDRVIGRRLDEVLPTGADQTRWRRMLNESQMIFHQFRALDHPNQQGMGLWFWGAGNLPAERPSVGPVYMTGLHGTDGLSDTWRGLAHWLNIDVIEQPEYVDRPGTGLIDAGIVDSEAALAELEQHWIQPAWQALATGKLNQLMLIGSDRAWRIGRFDRWAWWRRAKEHTQ